MSLSDRWNPDAGTDDATWTFSLKDAADLELTYSLTGLTIDWLMRATAAAGASEDQNAAMMEMVSELGVASARLSVTDRSLLDRGFGVAAQKQGLTIDGAAYREADARGAAVHHFGGSAGGGRKARDRTAAGLPRRRPKAACDRGPADADPDSGSDEGRGQIRPRCPACST